MRALLFVLTVAVLAGCAKGPDTKTAFQQGVTACNAIGPDSGRLSNYATTNDLRAWSENDRQAHIADLAHRALVAGGVPPTVLRSDGWFLGAGVKLIYQEAMAPGPNGLSVKTGSCSVLADNILLRDAYRLSGTATAGPEHMVMAVRGSVVWMASSNNRVYGLALFIDPTVLGAQLVNVGGHEFAALDIQPPEPGATQVRRGLPQSVGTLADLNKALDQKHRAEFSVGGRLSN